MDIGMGGASPQSDFLTACCSSTTKLSVAGGADMVHRGPSIRADAPIHMQLHMVVPIGPCYRRIISSGSAASPARRSPPDEPALRAHDASPSHGGAADRQRPSAV